MKNDWAKHARIKQVKTDKSIEVMILQDIYNQYTGQLEKTIERPVDIKGIDNRIATLNEEASILQGIKDKINAKDFDVVDDRTTPKVPIELKKLEGNKTPESDPVSADIELTP